MARASGSTNTAIAAAKEIASRRLRAQLLSTTTFTRPVEVVARLGAVQAQDYLGALWAVGLRLVDAHARDIELAIEQRTIVRSWPMRGTLHFVAAADARWMIDLLSPRAAAAARGRLHAMGLDERALSRARRALVKHLEGGRRLTRPAAYRLLESAGISTEGQRGLHVLWRLAHDGLVCLGPHEGKQPTVVLLEEWLPGAKRLARDESLAELARRYFTGHGPATAQDFAWWAGLTLADARRATSLAGSAVEGETIEGQRYWSAPSAHPPDTVRLRGQARALPPFDEFLVGYRDRSAAVDPAHAARLTAFEILGPVVIFDGQLVATWKRRILGRKAVLSIAPLSRLSKGRVAAVERALARYVSFFGLTATTLREAAASGSRTRPA
jgi:hypothetical protein